jgi:undecaprenyl-diphosphatase
LSVFHAIVLGIVQGLTEFIPVSSSGHLIAIPYLLGWEYQSKAFDVATHLGTLVALLIYFRRDWVCIIRDFSRHTLYRKPYEPDSNGWMLVPILVGCVPAGIVGVFWENTIETALSVWNIVAPTLVVFGILMLYAEKVGRQNRSITGIGYLDVIIIGCAQAVALIPGVSRSGITISAGLLLGLDRASAARFSFLLSTPAIIGAGLVSLRDGVPSDATGTFIAGFLAAAVSGYLAIRFLMVHLVKRSLNVFAWYRFGFAVLMVAAFVLKR